MSVQNHSLYAQTTEKTDIIDITPQVATQVTESAIENGLSPFLSRALQLPLQPLNLKAGLSMT